MSVQFYTDMARMQKHAYNIQMLEGSHPYEGDAYRKQVREMADGLEKIEKKMLADLKKRFVDKAKKNK